MRFSIFEYSQEKLVSLGLDVADALLLNWFANFFSGKMEKRIFKDTCGQNKVFGWIRISKVQEDLPVLGISTEKGIRRRFDNFVEKGLLERETINSQTGKKSFYKTTDLYESLLNTEITKKEVIEENINPQRNSSSFAEQTTIQNKNENSQGTKITYAKNKAAYSTDKSSQRNYSSYAERNCKTYAQGNSSSYALNDSLNSDYVIKDTAAIQELSDNFFGKNAFDTGFVTKAAAFFSQNKIQNKYSYFDFIKNKVNEKSSSTQTALINPRGFAYKLFFQTDIVQEFKNQEQLIQSQNQKQNEKIIADEKRKITCPVCEERFLPDFKDNCPVCEFEIKKFSNTAEIQIFKRLIKLPDSERKTYEAKLKAIYINFLGIMRLSAEERELQRKKQETQIQKLNSEFGLTG